MIASVLCGIALVAPLRVAPQPRLAPVRMAVDDTPALGRRAALFGAATALTLGSPFEASAAYRQENMKT